jgi:hypothetical protein
MRLWSIVLAFVSLALSFAVAQAAYHLDYYHRYHHHRYKTGATYSACTCHFGYGDICVVAVSCSAEGGRCSGSCVPSPQSENSTPPAAENSTPTATGASAVTAEIAKKCQALTAQAYPPRIPGNPAAGSANGSAESRHDYFSKCVANGGNTDDHSDNGAK